MTANISPIFSRTPDVQISGTLNSGTILGPTAVTAQDGTGALLPIFQADSTEGGYVDTIVLKSVGSPAFTVARVFLCNVTGAFTSGSSNTASTTVLLAEITLPTITASNTLAQPEFSIPIRRPIPAGWRLLIGFATSTGSAGTGYVTTTFGGKY